MTVPATEEFERLRDRLVDDRDAAQLDPRLADPAWGEAPLGYPRLARVRLLLAANVLAGIWYFTWLLQPSRVGFAPLYGVLLLAEFFNLAQAVGFWGSISRQRRRPPAPAFDPSTRVDVFVPRYDEPVQIVEPVLRAARAMRGADVMVHLLDDGDSEEMFELASSLGVSYISRTRHNGAKAGNINHALTLTDAPYIVVFDCDHVPHPDFLLHTLGLLVHDERMALVQTPQHYANALDNEVAAAAWSQQALFFGCIARGKDTIGAMFCCGTNVALRRAALGNGFPEGSLTEDFSLSIRLHENGWKTAYVPEVLAQGLGPEDMGSYIGQQLRWARGCLSGMADALFSRLPLRIKAQYVLSSMYFLTGWTVLIYMMLPVVRILTGRQPLATTNADQFLLHFAPYYALCLASVAIAGGGKYTFRAFALSAATFWVHVTATLLTLARRRGRFAVTPKSAVGRRQPLSAWPTLLTVALLVAVMAYGLWQSRNASMFNNIAFAGVHTSILLIGISAAFHRPSTGGRFDFGS